MSRKKWKKGGKLNSQMTPNNGNGRRRSSRGPSELSSAGRLRGNKKRGSRTRNPQPPQNPIKPRPYAPCPHACFNYNLSMELSCNEETWGSMSVREFGVCGIWWDDNPDACHEPCNTTNIGYGDCHLDCNPGANESFGWGGSCQNQCIRHPHTGQMCCAHMFANGDYIARVGGHRSRPGFHQKPPGVIDSGAGGGHSTNSYWLLDCDNGQQIDVDCDTGNDGGYSDGGEISFGTVTCTTRDMGCNQPA